MLNSASAMVFHFGCELHEQYSFSHMFANIEERGRGVDARREGRNEDGVKGQNAENNKLERKRGGEKDRGRQRD